MAVLSMGGVIVALQWIPWVSKNNKVEQSVKKNAPPVAAEGAESNIRASTLDGFILLAVAKKSILFVNYALFLWKGTMRPAKLPLDRTEPLVLSYEVHHEENYLKQEHE